MPRYFFNQTDGVAKADEEGTEFADINGARLQAVILAGEVLRENPERIWHGRDCRVEVTDQSGRVFLTVLAQVIEDANGPAQ